VRVEQFAEYGDEGRFAVEERVPEVEREDLRLLANVSVSVGAIPTDGPNVGINVPRTTGSNPPVSRSVLNPESTPPKVLSWEEVYTYDV
jgi:hypothetical protein